MLPPAPTYDALCEAFEWRIPMRYNMGLDVCDRWAADEPDRLVIIDLTGETRRDGSFAEVKRLSDGLALHLHGLGIGPGDGVGVLRPQSVWTAAAHIAVWKLGAISIPLFTLFGEEALATRLSDSGARVVVTDAENAERLAGFDLETVVPDGLTLDTSAFTPADTAAEDPAILIYTSGTTGAPKGALHAHRALLGHLPGVEMSHDGGFQPGDVLWTPADWAWIDVLMPGLHHGVPVVAARLPKFTPEACAEVIATARTRNVFFPPTALRMLKAEGATLPGLRTVACGGEPLGAEMLDWGRLGLGVTINEFYGQTECNMVLSSCGLLFAPRPGATGRPVPGHEIAVIDEAGKVTDGEGDIAIRRGSPVMMLRYWNNPEATEEKFLGDWLQTGNRGIAEDGFIRFLGRADDVITSAGYRIGPAEIEDCLLKHDAVASVGVVGKPDPQRTEIVKAYVALKAGQTPDASTRSALQAHVKTRLAAYEYPREIDFVDTLPMTVTGKIIRKELKARATAEVVA